MVLIFILFIILLCVIAGTAYVLKSVFQRKEVEKSLKEEMDSLRSDMRESLNFLVEQLNQRLRDNMDILQNTNKVLGDRLDNSAKMIGLVSERLGRLQESSQRIFEIGKDIASLQELLRAPKIRGGIGEFFLSDMLSQIIPKGLYEAPYTFKNGHQVDAVIKFGHRIVPIDAKFPMENFRRLMESAHSPEAQFKSLKRQFAGDIKKHISDIAYKYILPDEGTFDFALMYIPAENVYYEIIIKDEKFSENTSLFQYALHKKVIPVSPNSFYAYLQVILLGLKGLTIQERAKEFLRALEQLRGDFDRFADDFSKIGRHLSNTSSCFEEAYRRFSKIQGQIGHLNNLKQITPQADIKSYEERESV